MAQNAVAILIFILLGCLGFSRADLPCLGPSAPVGTTGLQRVPLGQLTMCLEQIKINTDFATQTVHNLDKVFEAGYAFYYLARNITDSNYLNEYGKRTPNMNPFGWQLYKGDTEGKVRTPV